MASEITRLEVRSTAKVAGFVGMVLGVLSSYPVILGWNQVATIVGFPSVGARVFPTLTFGGLILGTALGAGIAISYNLVAVPFGGIRVTIEDG